MAKKSTANRMSHCLKERFSMAQHGMFPSRGSEYTSSSGMGLIQMTNVDKSRIQTSSTCSA